jgi:hypothetical protein
MFKIKQESSMKNRISFIRVNLVAMSVLAALVLVFTACNKSNDDNTDVPVAGVIAFNLAPEISSGSITLSGNVLTATPLAYGSYTGTYLRVFPGQRPVQAYSSGQPITTAENVNFEAEKYYSLFLVGADSAYRTVTVNDNFDSLTATTGKAFIRYINAIPESSNQTVTISSGGLNVVNDNAAFASVSEFVEVDAGDVAINVTNGGSVNVSRTIALESLNVYTVLVSGLPGETGSNAVQIKYITNGVLDGTNASRVGSAAARQSN